MIRNSVFYCSLLKRIIYFHTISKNIVLREGVSTLKEIHIVDDCIY